MSNELEEKIRVVLEAKTNEFTELVKIAGLNPETDFTYSNLSNGDFSNCDLGGFDFTGSDIENAIFEGAKITNTRFDKKQRKLSQLNNAADYYSFLKRSIKLDSLPGSHGSLKGSDHKNLSLSNFDSYSSKIHDLTFNANGFELFCQEFHFEKDRSATRRQKKQIYKIFKENWRKFVRRRIDALEEISFEIPMPAKINYFFSNLATGKLGNRNSLAILFWLIWRDHSLLSKVKYIFSDTPLVESETQTIEQILEIIEKTKIFIEACKLGDLKTVMQSVEKMAFDINELDTNEDRTGLMLATEGNHIPTVNYLITAGVEINNVSSREKLSALNIACKKGYFQIANTLSKNDADLNQTTSNGTTALIAASENGHLGIVTLLIDKGARIDLARHSDGLTALMSASQSGNVDIVKLLLDAGNDINSYTKDFGKNALMIACFHGNTDVVEYLVERGAKINYASAYDGRTALIEASCNGHKDIVEILFGKGAKLNMRTKTGHTAVYYAEKHGHKPTYDLLIGFGADFIKIYKSSFEMRTPKH